MNYQPLKAGDILQEGDMKRVLLGGKRPIVSVEIGWKITLPYEGDYFRPIPEAKLKRKRHAKK